MPIATVTIQKFADILKAETELLCPKCRTPPQYSGGYHCEACKVDYNHWSKLQRVIKATGEDVLKEKFTQENQEPVKYVVILEKDQLIALASTISYGMMKKGRVYV